MFNQNLLHRLLTNQFLVQCLQFSSTRLSLNIRMSPFNSYLIVSYNKAYQTFSTDVIAFKLLQVYFISIKTIRFTFVEMFGYLIFFSFLGSGLCCCFPKQWEGLTYQTSSNTLNNGTVMYEEVRICIYYILF